MVKALSPVIKSTIEKSIDEKMGTILTEITNLKIISTQTQQHLITYEKDLNSLKDGNKHLVQQVSSNEQSIVDLREENKACVLN